MKIKKSLFYSCLYLIFVNSVYAQMTDLIGSMSIGALQNKGSIQSIGLVNKKLNSIQFIQELQSKIADISMTYFENYQNMNIQNLIIQNIKCVFRPVEQGSAFEVFISFYNDRNLCSSLITANWDNLKAISSSDRLYSQKEAIEQVDGICTTSDQISLIFQ